MEKEQLKKADKDLQLNNFFIDFDHKCNAQDLLKAYRHFFNELGRFPGSLEFAIVPEGNIPNFINSSYIILPSDLQNRFGASDARELVSLQMLTSLHMYLGGSPSLLQRTMTEFYHNLYMLAISKSDDIVRLEFIAVINLVKNIVQHLNDSIETAIVSTKESHIYFASFLNKKEKEQHNMHEIGKATTENSVEIKKKKGTANCTIRR